MNVKKIAGLVFTGVAAAAAYVGAHYLISGKLPGERTSYQPSATPFEHLMTKSAAASFLKAPEEERLVQIRLTLDLVGRSCSEDLVVGLGTEDGDYLYVPVSCGGQAFAYALELEGASTSIMPCAEFSRTIPGVCE